MSTQHKDLGWWIELIVYLVLIAVVIYWSGNALGPAIDYEYDRLCATSPDGQHTTAQLASAANVSTATTPGSDR